MGARRPRGIFVMGCPRSGTTAIGRYVASSTDVCDLGEYGAFHVALHHAPRELRRMPGPHKAAYLDSLAAHATTFARSAAASADCGWFLDDTPWNLLSVERLAALAPDAVMVLCLRHYRGTIQSLQRSYSQGFTFAGRHPRESAAVWCRLYANVTGIRAGRFIALSYDQLCAEPGATLDRLDAALADEGMDPGGFNRQVLATSHAVPADGSRPTIARFDPDRGTAVLTPRPSFDPTTWGDDTEAEVRPIVAAVDTALAKQFAGTYCMPSPERYTCHGTMPLPTP